MAAAAEAQRRPWGVIEHSEGFHRLIVEASDNRLLGDDVESLRHHRPSRALTMVTLELDLGYGRRSPTSRSSMRSGPVTSSWPARVSREHQAWFVEMLNARAEQRATATAEPA